MTLSTLGGQASTNAPARTTAWRPLFWAIVLIPWTAVAVLVVLGIARLIAMNHVRVDQLESWLNTHLSQLPSSPPATRTLNGVTSIEGQEAFIPLNPPGDAQHLIYVLGASSVVLPTTDVAFPARLGARLGPSFRVANLGRAGVTSGTMLATLRTALAVRTPELLILYEGHNDYNYAYRAAVLPAYGFIEGSATLDFLARSILIPAFGLDEPRYWSTRSEVVDPRINRWLQDVGLLHIDPHLVDAVDGCAQRYFERNFDAMLAEAQTRGVAVVLITPISNMEWPPFGAGPTATEEYRAGMMSADYRSRISHLQRARDLDVFNGFKRAKSAVAAYLHQRQGAGVHVLDLEQILIDEQFHFGDGPFLDQMHMSADTHERVAQSIYDVLTNEDVCCGLGARRRRASR